MNEPLSLPISDDWGRLRLSCAVSSRFLTGGGFLPSSGREGWSGCLQRPLAARHVIVAAESGW